MRWKRTGCFGIGVCIPSILEAFKLEVLMSVGFSYGTVLGATVASMFPDRMDKVILDGVMNPHEYYHGTG